jgi:hypothetical protein
MSATITAVVQVRLFLAAVAAQISLPEKVVLSV